MSTKREVHGVSVQGSEPKQLLLSDGSSLALASREDGAARWERSESGNGVDGEVSVPEAMRLAGNEFSGYVTVRTRAESEWLRAVAQWCDNEAGRLEGELASASG